MVLSDAESSFIGGRCNPFDWLNSQGAIDTHWLVRRTSPHCPCSIGEHGRRDQSPRVGESLAVFHGVHSLRGGVVPREVRPRWPSSWDIWRFGEKLDRMS